MLLLLYLNELVHKHRYTNTLKLIYKPYGGYDYVCIVILKCNFSVIRMIIKCTVNTHSVNQKDHCNMKIGFGFKILLRKLLKLFFCVPRPTESESQYKLRTI